MTRDGDMARETAAVQPERETTGAGTGPLARCIVFRRPARAATAAAAMLVAGALLAGCGDKDTGASKPRRVKGDPAPAGIAQNGKKGGGSGKNPQGKNSSTPPSNADSSGSSGAADGAATGGGSGGSEQNGGGSGTGGSGSACTGADLKASVGPSSPGAGQKNFPLVFTNNSDHTCTMKGYPGLAFINGAGEQISVPPQRTPGSGQTVELAPGASAWAPLSYANPEISGAETVTPQAALLTPPDQRDSLRVEWPGEPVTASDDASVPKIGSLSPGTGG
jgi:hypothetical protein